MCIYIVYECIRIISNFLVYVLFCTYFFVLYFYIDIVYECIVLRCIVKNKLTLTLLLYIMPTVNTITRRSTEAGS